MGENYSSYCEKKSLATKRMIEKKSQVHTSGDVAAVLTGQVLYAHHSTKNRDINGYYVAVSKET